MPTHRTPEPPTTEQIVAFSRLAQDYFEDISDPNAKRFTLRYTEFLQLKAHGTVATEPAGEAGVSMLDCRLIRNVLRSLYKQAIHPPKQQRKDDMTFPKVA